MHLVEQIGTFHVSFEETLQSGCQKFFSQNLYQTPQVPSPQTPEWALPQGLSEQQHHVLPLKQADSLLLPARTAKCEPNQAETRVAKTNFSNQQVPITFCTILLTPKFICLIQKGLMLQLRVAQMFYNRNQCWGCAQVALVSQGTELHTALPARQCHPYSTWITMMN